MTAPVDFYPEFLDRVSADTIYAVLKQELAWVRRENTPRSEYWTNTYDRSYTYGRGFMTRTYHAQPDHRWIIQLRNRLQDTHGVFLEACFLNWYQTEKDHLGYHADDEKMIDHSKPIAIVTLGDTRELMVRPTPTRGTEGQKLTTPPEVFPLSHGSLLMMRPGMQQTHQHGIRKGSFAGSERISLTFRGLLP